MKFPKLILFLSCAAPLFGMEKNTNNCEPQSSLVDEYNVLANQKNRSRKMNDGGLQMMHGLYPNPRIWLIKRNEIDPNSLLASLSKKAGPTASICSHCRKPFNSFEAFSKHTNNCLQAQISNRKIRWIANPITKKPNENMSLIAEALISLRNSQPKSH